MQPEPAELRLGKLLDLSKSVRLAAAQLPADEPESDTHPTRAAAIRADFLEVRAYLLKGIELSFNPGERYTRLKLPTPLAACRTDTLQ